MRNEELESETDRLTEDLMRGAAHDEARLDLALEGQAPQTGNVDDVDRAALAEAEAEALVKQMRAQMGGGVGGPAPNEAIDPVQNPDGPVSSKPAPAARPAPGRPRRRRPRPRRQDHRADAAPGRAAASGRGRQDDWPPEALIACCVWRVSPRARRYAIRNTQ